MPDMEDNRNKEQNLVDSIYDRLRVALPNDLTIERTPFISSIVAPEFLVSRGDTKLAIVDVKCGYSSCKHRQKAEQQVSGYALKYRYRYAIIASDDGKFWFKDCYLNVDERFAERPLEHIAYVLDIVNKPERFPGVEYREALFKAIELFLDEEGKKDYKEIKNHNSSSYNRRKKLTNLQDFLVKYRSTLIRYDETSFYFDMESVEDALFECFLKAFKGEKVCRYTSLSSFFRTIDEVKQSMCCLVGMNDKSECTYADNYLKGDYLGQTDQSLISSYEAEEENSFFILSCMDERKYDDLIMWRLYGDGTKGVNVKYTIDKKNLQGYKLYHIDYAEKDGESGHFALNFIKLLLDLNIKGKKFRLRKWNEWKHFFKPFEYKDELEIRLLYRKEEDTEIKWILTNDYNIVCPLAKHELKRFPLIIDEILLGPNCPDASVNFRQLNLLIQNKNDKVRTSDKENLIKRSKIVTYRM